MSRHRIGSPSDINIISTCLFDKRYTELKCVCSVCVLFNVQPEAGDARLATRGWRREAGDARLATRGWRCEACVHSLDLSRLISPDQILLTKLFPTHLFFSSFFRLFAFFGLFSFLLRLEELLDLDFFIQGSGEHNDE